MSTTNIFGDGASHDVGYHDGRTVRIRMMRSATTAANVFGVLLQSPVVAQNVPPQPGLPISRSGAFQTLLPLCASAGFHRLKRPGSQ